MRLRRWVLVGVVVVAASAVAAVRMGERMHLRTVRAVPATDTAATPKAEAESPGRTLYLRACVMCHGERGAGTAIGPALADSARDLAATVQVVQSGVPNVDHAEWTPMPPRGDGTYSDAEVRQVAEYVRTLAR